MLLIAFSGNVLVIGASTSIVLAVTWAGVLYSWSSWKILLPLVLGVVGLVAFFAYEAFVADYPVVRTTSQTLAAELTQRQIPRQLLSTRTGLSGYTQCFLMNMVLIMIICKSSSLWVRAGPLTPGGVLDYAPIYLQACKLLSPTHSGVLVLSIALIVAVAAVAAGVLAAKTGRYRA
jgi:hypothetical protein